MLGLTRRRQTKTERDRQPETDRDRDRKTERVRDRERQRQADRERQRQRGSDTACKNNNASVTYSSDVSRRQVHDFTDVTREPMRQAVT